MQTTTIKGTALTISRVAFGTASIHHLSSADEQVRLLMAALDAGITHFDTAPYYGFGRAESALAALTGKAVSVATKAGLYPPGGTQQSRAAMLARKIAGKLVPSLSRPDADLGVARAKASLDGSLARLKRERIDVLFLHEPDHRMFDTDEWRRWIESETDRIGAVGVSGEASHVLPFIDAGERVAQVVQTRDSAHGREAAPVRSRGRLPALTFGHLARRSPDSNTSAIDALRQALKAHPTEAVLVSTRQAARITDLARAGD